MVYERYYAVQNRSKEMVAAIQTIPVNGFNHCDRVRPYIPGTEVRYDSEPERTHGSLYWVVFNSEGMKDWVRLEVHRNGKANLYGNRSLIELLKTKKYKLKKINPKRSKDLQNKLLKFLIPNPLTSH